MSWGSGEFVNLLLSNEIDTIVNYMLNNNISTNTPFMEIKTFNGANQYFCNLKPTKTKKGEDKYAQFDITRFNMPQKDNNRSNPKKILVHLLMYRWLNVATVYNGNNIYTKLDRFKQVSHLHEDNKWMILAEEDEDINDSRKVCHKYKMYSIYNGELAKRCFHHETPCVGDTTDFSMTSPFV